MILKFLKYLIFSNITYYNKKNVKKINVISLAGIGDSIYAAIFCAESQIDCTLYTYSKNIEICTLYYDKVYDIKHIDYSERFSCYYSDRSNLSLLDLMKIYKNKSCFVKNNIYESFNLVKRICNKFDINNLNYYGENNARTRFYNDLNYKLLNRKFVSIYKSLNVCISKNKYVIIHPYGSDNIRKLTKEQIKNISNVFKNDKIYVVGSKFDLDNYNENFEFITFEKVENLLEFLSGAKNIICVDSMVSHLVTTTLSNNITIYYGNTFSSYYMPQNFTNIKILNNYQNCTPCNRKNCNKINNLSCVQNIFIK